MLQQVGEHLDTLSPQPAPVQEPAAAAVAEQASGAENMDTESAEAPQAPESAAADAAEPQQAAQPPGPHAQRYQRLRGILTGSTPIQLYLEFLYTHNHADLQILRNMKGAVEARNSVCHSAVIFANATMHSGTTVDAFLRENLDWLSRATNWAKFNATAGLGVIHRYALSAISYMQRGSWLCGHNREPAVVCPAKHVHFSDGDCTTARTAPECAIM